MQKESIAQAIFERTLHPINTARELLSQGHKVYYSIGNGENVVEYPDGRKFKVIAIGKNPVEVEPYYGKSPV